MGYRDWPHEIKGNRFALAKLDPEVPPAQMRVVTWGNMFEAGGHVAIEGYDAEGKRLSTDFGGIQIESNRGVEDERAHLQSLLDNFLDDLPGNWRALIEGARAYVDAFYAKQAAEYAEKAAKAARGVFS